MPLSSSPFKSLAILAAAIVSSALITGCGIGPSAKTDTPIAGMTGTLHGGPNPIVGSTITLYATTNAAYGTAGTQLAQTTTDANGFFTFSSVATCPSGQQAYVTASGGNTGSNANNPQVLLMAAIGPCSHVGPSNHIFISEVSTVAAGYALSNFIGINGTTVNISAPITNNAATPFCIGTGSGQTCVTSGLAHAFLNAANLVDASEVGSVPTGQTYTTTPGNTNGTVPTLLINTLGNILQSCVNSAGGAAGDATNCGTLFTNATPPTSSTPTPVTPTNTLQAVINLAKFPTMTSTQIAALYALATPQTFFVPSLSAAPSDFSLAIAYTGPTSSTNFIYGFFTVLDISDSSYTFTELGNGGTTGPVSVASMSSNGASGYKGAAIPNTLCAAANPCAAGVDSAGHLWLANFNTTANNNVYELNTSNGALVNTYAFPSGTSANSAAVDKYNNVYVTSANNTVANLYVKAPTDSAFTPVQSGSTPADTMEPGAAPEYIAIDGKGSIWNTNFTSGAPTASSYLENTGTTSAVFGNSVVSTTESASVGSVESIAIDSANNGWVNNQVTLFKVAPGATAPTTSFTISGPGGASATAKAASSARFMSLDGDGNIILPDNTPTSTIWQFYNSTGNFVFMAPCIGNSGSTCNSATGTPRVVSPRNAVTDSTGSVWISVPVAIGGANNLAGSLTQIIGTAAPTMPQLSAGRPGVRP